MTITAEDVIYGLGLLVQEGDAGSYHVNVDEARILLAYIDAQAAKLDAAMKQCQELARQSGRLGARAAIAERELARYDAVVGQLPDNTIINDDTGPLSDRVNWSMPVGTKLFTAPQPASITVPDEITPEQAQKIAPADFYEMDNDELCVAADFWNACRTAMLEHVSQPYKLNYSAIPDGLIVAVNHLLDVDGSRGCYSAVECHDAREKVERLLAAAPEA